MSQENTQQLPAVATPAKAKAPQGRLIPQQPDNIQYFILRKEHVEKGIHHQVMILIDRAQKLKNLDRPNIKHLYTDKIHNNTDVYIVIPNLMIQGMELSDALYTYPDDSAIINIVGERFINPITNQPLNDVFYDAVLSEFCKEKLVFENNDRLFFVSPLYERLQSQTNPDEWLPVPTFTIDDAGQALINPKISDINKIGSIFGRNRSLDKKRIAPLHHKHDNPPSDETVYDVSAMALSYFKPEQVGPVQINRMKASYDRHLKNNFAAFRKQLKVYYPNQQLQKAITSIDSIPDAIDYKYHSLVAILADLFFCSDNKNLATVLKEYGEENLLTGLVTQSELNGLVKSAIQQTENDNSIPHVAIDINAAQKQTQMTHGLFIHQGAHSEPLAPIIIKNNTPEEKPIPDVYRLESNLATLLYTHFKHIIKSPSPAIFAVIDGTPAEGSCVFFEDVLLQYDWYRHYFTGHFTEHNKTFSKKAFKGWVIYYPSIKKTFFLAGFNVHPSAYTSQISSYYAHNNEDFIFIFSQILQMRQYTLDRLTVPKAEEEKTEEVETADVKEANTGVNADGNDEDANNEKTDGQDAVVADGATGVAAVAPDEIAQKVQNTTETPVVGTTSNDGNEGDIEGNKTGSEKGDDNKGDGEGNTLGLKPTEANTTTVAENKKVKKTPKDNQAGEDKTIKKDENTDSDPNDDIDQDVFLDKEEKKIPF